MSAARSAPAGFGRRMAPGTRPAVLVVDMNLGFTDPASPLACPLEGVVAAIARLLDAARAAGAPVAYTTVAYGPEDRETAAAFLEKVPALATLEAGTRWVEIDPRLAPQEGEPVFTKLYASGFWGTDLGAWLAEQRVDTLVVTGASTSGCVRASVLDALQHGLRPIVPEEAVGDRDRAAHEANLHDVAAKYGDVVALGEALELLAGRAASAGQPQSSSAKHTW